MHIGWNQPLSPATRQLDSLQLELFRRVTQLVEAARDQRAPEARAHVARLSELARHLFESEEQNLREARPGEPGAPRPEHQRFLADLAVVSAELGRRGPARSPSSRWPAT